jgi:uncharacterized protein (UPF0548 family)
MARWRFGRGWSEVELAQYLAEIAQRSINFSASPNEMTEAAGWKVDGSNDILGSEPPGPPVVDGLFERARPAVENYRFSDPRIVRGHFDPHSSLDGRNILLEIKLLGLHFLNGVRITGVRDDQSPEGAVFGFCYATLEGHIERGLEWFLLHKDYRSGCVTFTIQARWQMGDFPNWWSRLGFILVGQHVRKLWRRLAHRRLEQAARAEQPPVPAPGKLSHSPER